MYPDKRFSDVQPTKQERLVQEEACLSATTLPASVPCVCGCTCVAIVWFNFLLVKISLTFMLSRNPPAPDPKLQRTTFTRTLQQNIDLGLASAVSSMYCVQCDLGLASAVSSMYCVQC